MAAAGPGPILHQTYIECDGCEDDVDVEWYCLSCKSNLCGKCRTARLHRKHTIKAWMDPAAVSARQDAPMPCDIHPDKTYVNYCSDCSVLCCSTCNAGDHSGHQFKTIEDVFDGKLNDMKKIVEELKGGCLALATRQKEKLNKNVEKCNFQCTLNKEKIKQRIASLKNDLSLMEDALIQDEESRRKENMKKLQKELSYVEEMENKIAKAVKDIEKEISISNRQSIILTSVSFSTLGEFKVLEANDLPDRKFKISNFKFPSAAETVGLSEQRGESTMKPVHIPSQRRQRHIDEQRIIREIEEFQIEEIEESEEESDEGSEEESDEGEISPLSMKVPGQPRQVHPRQVHPRQVHPRQVHPRQVHPRQGRIQRPFEDPRQVHGRIQRPFEDPRQVHGRIQRPFEDFRERALRDEHDV